MHPAAIDAARVPILDMSSKSPSPSASEAINKDMVKPIPQSQLAPKIWAQETVAGRDASPVADAIQANKEMPSGLPSSKPRSTPMVIGWVRAVPTLPNT